MLEFMHPAALFGLAFAGVPILLHLMHRARPRPQAFPAARFVPPAPLPRQGRRRLEDLFLLILRCLVIALIALTVARPRFVRPPAAGRGNKQVPRPAVIVFDTSASMQAGNARTDLLKQVRAWLARNPHRPIGLIASSGGIDMQHPVSGNRSDILAALKRLTPTLREGRHQKALDLAATMLEENHGGTILIAADMQEHDWAAVQRPLNRKNIDFEIVTCPNYQRENAGITRVTVRPLPENGRRITVHLANYGTREITRTVRVQIGERSTERSVTLPPGARRAVAFAVSDVKEDAGRARLSPKDAYAVDDEWWFWAGPLPAATVLIAAPFRQEPGTRVSAFFVRKAIETHDPDAPAMFRVELTDASQFFALNLDAADGLILLGAPGYLGGKELRQVAEFVKRGKTVITTSPRSAGTHFRKLRMYNLLPVEYRGIADAAEQGRTLPFTIAETAANSALERLFPDPGDADLFLCPVYRYARIDMADATQCRVLLSLDTGDPALVEHRLGRGRLFCWTFGFAPEWTDLPLTTAFLPILRELLRDAAERERVHSIAVGDPVVLPRDLLDSAPRATANVDTSCPSAFAVAGRPFEVNVSRAESDPNRISPDELRARLTESPSPTISPTGTGTARRNAAVVVELRPRTAVAAAILFVLEFLVAARLRGSTGRRRAGTDESHT